MRKKILLAMALFAMLLALPLGSAFAVESFVQPSGVIQYNPDKSYGGYQLFSGTGAGNTISYLVDMEGYVVHRMAEGLCGLPARIVAPERQPPGPRRSRGRCRCRPTYWHEIRT